jgi:hypothetical protein
MVDHEFVSATLLVDDDSTHRGQSFLDLRLHVCYRDNLVNLHLMTMLMFE